MAKLKAVLDSLEGLGEGLAEVYVKGGDDKYYLDAEGLDAHPTVLPALKKKNELLDEVKTLRGKLVSFDGIEDPEVAKAAIARLAELEAGGEGKVDERIAAVRKDYETRIETLKRAAAEEKRQAEEKSKASEQAARNFFVQSETHRAIRTAGGEPALLEHAVRRSVRDEIAEDGSFRLVVLDRNGEPRVKDSALNPFTIDDLVIEMREDPTFGRGFAPTGGGGSGPLNTGGGGARVAKRSDLKTAAEKAAFIGKHGRDAYLDLPE